MNKSLKFLAIGLALAVLLVSQVGVNRTDTAEAAAVNLDDEMVEFTDDAGEEKDFFKSGDTVHFFLKDDSLALPTSNQRTTVEWKVTDDVPNDPRTTFNLFNGSVGDNSDIDGTTFSSTSTKYANYAPLNTADPPVRDASLTPLVGSPTVTTVERDANGNDVGTERELTVVGLSRNAGTFELLDQVEHDRDGSTATDTILKVVFEYEVADVFMAKHTGTPARTENRAKVTSSSDGVGDWVTIREVADEGSMDPASRSHIYYGSIVLSDDSVASATSSGHVWVRDGDTLTVTFYEDDHVTVIDSDEATIDDEDPGITGFDPANNAKLDDTAPPVSFTMSDDGAGFDTKEFTDNVDLLVVNGISACLIDDEELTATSLTQPEVEVLFRTSRNWGTQGVGPCAAPGDAAAVTALTTSAGLVDDDGDSTVNFVAAPGFLNVNTTALGANNHGMAFDIIAVSEDGAGNTGMAKVTVTIDTEDPGIDQNDSQTGLTWDTAKNKEANSRAAIRVAFTESLRPDTVDVEDFTVENPDMTIASVIVGGVNTEDDNRKDEYVYLVLAGDLASDARPRVELDGSIRDVAGNELKKASIARVADKIKPKVTVDDFSAQLLPDKGESTITFSADENMGSTASAIRQECTCLVITGGGGEEIIGDDNDGVDKGAVSLPTPSTGRHTFKQSSGSRATGIYGVLVQASDSQANVTQAGAVKVTNEEVAVKAADVTGITQAIPADEDAGTAAVPAELTVTLKLKNWPLTDSDTDESLADEVEVRTSTGTAAVAGVTVTTVDWEDGTVTLKVVGTGLDSTLLNSAKTASKDGTVYVTYSYVHADQVIQVDKDAPGVEFFPRGDTQEARPFVRIQFNDAEYAGDTHTTVTVTSATLTDPDGNETVLVDEDMNLLSTSDNKLFSYLPPSDLALGEYTIAAVGRDAAGNATEEMSGKFKVIARPKVTIPLTLGWNLIALPATPTDMSIDTVIDVAAVETVLTYDPTVEGGWQAAVRVNGSFEGALTMIDATKAYLVYTTSEQDLKVDIPGLMRGSLPPAVQLYAGWNLVPSSSLDPAFPARDVDAYFSGLEWTRGYYYDSDGRLTGFTPGTGAGATSDDTLVVKGRGFFLYLTEDGTLVP